MRFYCRSNNNVSEDSNSRENNGENINSSCNRMENLLDSLCDEIGNRCNCQFAVGDEGDLEDRSGILDKVGGNFIVLRSAETGNKLYCNASNLQFISVFNTR
jgi:hypothetical protein